VTESARLSLWWWYMLEARRCFWLGQRSQHSSETSVTPRKRRSRLRAASRWRGFTCSPGSRANVNCLKPTR